MNVINSVRDSLCEWQSDYESKTNEYTEVPIIGKYLNRDEGFYAIVYVEDKFKDYEALRKAVDNTDGVKYSVVYRTMSEQHECQNGLMVEGGDQQLVIDFWEK